MASHRTPLTSVRLKSFRQEMMFVLTIYLLMVFILQCVGALPAGLHPERHRHVAPEASAAAYIAQRTSQRHAHDEEFHSHASDATGIIPLGETGDEASFTPGLALGMGIWPASLLFALVRGRETFGRAAHARFSSRGTRVPLKPPQRG